MKLVRSRWDGGGGGVGFLLVHGLASNRRLWDGVGPALAAAGHTAVAVDLRGHGESPKVDDGYDWDTLCGDLASVLAEEGLDRSVVVGQSFGASLALELAMRRPDLCGGVACVDGAVLSFGERFPTWSACESALAPPVFEGVRWEALAERFPFAVEAFMACFSRLPDGTVAPRLRRDAHMRLLRLLWEHRPLEAFARVGVPVLLLPCRGGVADEAFVDRAAAVLGDRGSVRWFDAGHDVHAQYPAEVADALLEAFVPA